MGGAYLREALQPGPREISADVADFLFLSVTGITGPSSDFYVNFLLVTPGSKNSNPKPVCGAGMITSFQQRPFLYLVLNFLACQFLVWKDSTYCGATTSMYHDY